MQATEQKKQSWQQLREDRKKWGLCVTCGKRSPAPKRVQCEFCLCKNSEAKAKNPTWRKPEAYATAKARRDRYRALGLCIICGKPAYKEHVRCYECFLRAKRHKAAYDERHRTGRVKPWNSPPPIHAAGQDHPWRNSDKIVFQKKKQAGE